MSERKAPKERKPLIAPGSVLGESPDIFANVMSSYAESTGQPAPVVRGEDEAAEAEPGAPVEDEEAALLSDAHEEQPTQAAEPAPSSPEPRRRTETARQPADKSARQPKAPAVRSPKKASATDAEDEAKVRAATPKRLCSYRVPEGLDDWLEEQAFEHRHTGLKKQDLIAQAIQLLIVAKSTYQEEEQD